MKRLLKIGLVLILVSTVLLTTACGQGSEEKMKVRLYEVTHSIFYAPQYVALSQGFFEEEGLTVELTNGAGGDKTMTALLSDAADVILVGTETTIYVKAQGSNDPAINFAQLTQRDGTFLVSRNPIQNFSWDMLKGKVLLGQRKGGMPQMVGEFTLKKNGIDPFKDMEVIQNVDFANIGPAFISGTGDFVQLFEPVASQVELDGKGYVVASMGTESGKLPYTVYIAKQSTINKNPKMIQKFTNAVYKAQQWVEKATTQEIVEAIKDQFPGVSDEILSSVIERYKSQGTWATDPILDEEEYQNLLNVMESAGELPSKVPYNEIVNTDFAKKAIEAGK